jgi:hypothetical protein
MLLPPPLAPATLPSPAALYAAMTADAPPAALRTPAIIADPAIDTAAMPAAATPMAAAAPCCPIPPVAPPAMLPINGGTLFTNSNNTSADTSKTAISMMPGFAFNAEICPDKNVFPTPTIKIIVIN